jgi:hypothetical protein
MAFNSWPDCDGKNNVRVDHGLVRLFVQYQWTLGRDPDEAARIVRMECGKRGLGLGPPEAIHRAAPVTHPNFSSRSQQKRKLQAERHKEVKRLKTEPVVNGSMTKPLAVDRHATTIPQKTSPHSRTQSGPTKHFPKTVNADARKRHLGRQVSNSVVRSKLLVGSKFRKNKFGRPQYPTHSLKSRSRNTATGFTRREKIKESIKLKNEISSKSTALSHFSAAKGVNVDNIAHIHQNTYKFETKFPEAPAAIIPVSDDLPEGPCSVVTEPGNSVNVATTGVEVLKPRNHWHSNQPQAFSERLPAPNPLNQSIKETESFMTLVQKAGSSDGHIPLPYGPAVRPPPPTYPPIWAQASFNPNAALV